MKKLKAAIVGCGRISVSYADAFHRLSDEVELVYAVDKDPALAKAFAEEFNCSWTTDFDEILDKDIDVVHLCLPHFLHPVMAIKAMKAGINVLTEKPIATCLQDADRMIRTAEETHVKLGVIFQTRYTKSVEKLREMIQRGDFGKILTARSYLTWNRSTITAEVTGREHGTKRAAVFSSTRRSTALIVFDICWIPMWNGSTEVSIIMSTIL